MIRVRDLKKVYKTRFGENLVFEGISFDLAMGERLGILGRNGAGKSTLVRLISGAERPTAGTIESDISISWPLAFSGAFQHQLTGADNVRFISRIYEQDFERNLAFVEEFAELGPYLREPVITYSSGMRARLAFAISMIIEFDCFLIDEVGAVGDARFHERCNFELFEKRADRAMIIISHDASYIRDHCNRFAVLHDTRLTLFDDFDAAFSHYGEHVGLSSTIAECDAPLSFAKRSAALDSLRRLALADDRFLVAVQQGDYARDRADWQTALDRYGAALTFHPYERSFWSQLGNAARDGGQLALAECAYRSACACGEPVGPLAAFLAATLEAQGLPPRAFPARSPDQGALADQPPAFPDLALLAAVCLGIERCTAEEGAALLRECESLDQLAARLLADPRARDWLARPITALSDKITMVPIPHGERGNWKPQLWRLICTQPTPEAPDASGVSPGDPATIGALLASQRAFANWPSASQALAALTAPAMTPSSSSRSMENNNV